MLARMYETDALCLLDLADHEGLDPRDRLTLFRPPPPRAAGPFGERLVALMDQRGLSLREVAHRVPCSPAHLSNLAHGRTGVSGQLAARLDGMLDASGELAALAAPPARKDRHPEPCGYLAHADAHGLSVSLSYVPGRVVIGHIRPGRRRRTGQRRAGYRATPPSPRPARPHAAGQQPMMAVAEPQDRSPDARRAERRVPAWHGDHATTTQEARDAHACQVH
jgi:transcriptional regulator with XRE-family HTH domain